MKGRAPMITADALASIDSAETLAFIFLRSRSTFERLPIASDRLPPNLRLDGDDDGEEVDFLERHVERHAGAGVGDAEAYLLRLDHAPEFALHRVGAFGGDKADRIVERQTRFDRARDDVKRIGKLVEKLGLAALDQEAENPARQTETGDDGDTDHDHPRYTNDEGDEQQHGGEDGADEIEFRHCDRQA